MLKLRLGLATDATGKGFIELEASRPILLIYRCTVLDLDRNERFSINAIWLQGLMAEHKEIRAMLERVRELEKTNLSRPIVGGRRANADALVEWLGQIGGEVKGIKVQDYKEEGLLQDTCYFFACCCCCW